MYVSPVVVWTSGSASLIGDVYGIEDVEGEWDLLSWTWGCVFVIVRKRC